MAFEVDPVDSQRWRGWERGLKPLDPFPACTWAALRQSFRGTFIAFLRRAHIIVTRALA